MAFVDIRQFISQLEKKGWLKRVGIEVDCELEITEITDRISKANGPGLLFEKVKGYDMPVLINAFGSFERVCLALGVKSLDDIASRLKGLIKPNIPRNMTEKLKLLPQLYDLSKFPPKGVKGGPVKEVIIKDNPSLSILPILKCWPGDAGRFITLPIIFTKDLSSGIQNLGMYRMQVFDERTCGMHWHIHKDGAGIYHQYEQAGKRMEVAVALGGDPTIIYAATAPLPSGIDEILFAGFLRQQPVEMVKCETVDIEVPAQAEIILEGYVEPGERRIEGPFGDHTGYYSPPDYYPIFHLTCITHRLQPIYPTTIVGRPPMEDCYLAKATERIFLPLIQLQLPEIKDLNLPMEGVFQNCAIISIKKSYPGQARKVISAVWGLGQMMFTKVVIVVDEEVNVQDLSEVAWRVLNNIDPKRDFMIVEGPTDVLNHASPNYGSKVGIDGTKKFKEEGIIYEFPDEIKMSPEIKRLVDERWRDYGLE